MKFAIIIGLLAIVAAGCSRPSYDWGRLSQGVGEAGKQ